MAKSIILSLFLCFASMEGGLIRLWDESAETRFGLYDVKKGMGKEDVLYIMGYPYQVKECPSGCRTYEIWFYIYQKPDFMQSRVMRRNLIPLVFYKNRLLGWGNKFYKHLFDLDGQREKNAYEDSKQYKDNKDHWPATDHRYVPHPTEKTDTDDPTLGTYREDDSIQEIDDAPGGEEFPGPAAEPPKAIILIPGNIDETTETPDDSTPQGATGATGATGPTGPVEAPAAKPADEEDTGDQYLFTDPVDTFNE